MTRILGRYEWRSREVSAGPKAAKKLGSSGNCVVNDRRMMQARALHFSPSSRRLLPYNLIRMCRPTPVQRDHGHHVDGSGVSEAAPVGNHNLIRSAVIGRFRVIRVAAPGRQPFTRRRRQRKGERLAFTADDAGQCGFSTRPAPEFFWLLRGHSISIELTEGIGLPDGPKVDTTQVSGPAAGSEPRSQPAGRRGLAVFWIRIIRPAARDPFRALVAVRGNATRVLYHPCEVHEVPRQQALGFEHEGTQM